MEVSGKYFRTAGDNASTSSFALTGEIAGEKSERAAMLFMAT